MANATSQTHSDPTYRVYFCDVGMTDDGEGCLVGGSSKTVTGLDNALAAASNIPGHHVTDLVVIVSDYGLHVVRWVSFNWLPGWRPSNLDELAASLAA